jgi:hypothetical protein
MSVFFYVAVRSLRISTLSINIYLVLNFDELQYNLTYITFILLYTILRCVYVILCMYAHFSFRLLKPRQNGPLKPETRHRLNII